MLRSGHAHRNNLPNICEFVFFILFRPYWLCIIKVLASDKYLHVCKLMAGVRSANEESDKNLQRLGAAGLALHYANVINQIDNIVSLLFLLFFLFLSDLIIVNCSYMGLFLMKIHFLLGISPDLPSS